MSAFTITRRIEIDAAHRIPDHRSKCRHLHGHRYVIEAGCANKSLHADGPERGMVLDFGFLKEEMLTLIDAPCDHALLLSVDDDALLRMLGPEEPRFADWLGEVRGRVERQGYHETVDARLGGRIYVLPEPPTAEVLAQHWFSRLAEPVYRCSRGHARLTSVTVWETPNCRARYSVE